jgi:hypothetical protein
LTLYLSCCSDCQSGCHVTGLYITYECIVYLFENLKIYQYSLDSTVWFVFVFLSPLSCLLFLQFDDMNRQDEPSQPSTEGKCSSIGAKVDYYKGFSDKRKRFLYGPYLVGLLWILCHPIVSIITGELKCRGIYTDEHMFDVRTFWSEPYPIITLGEDAAAQDAPEFMCQVIRNPLESDHVQLSLSPSLQCYEYNNISIVKITPHMAPTTPTEAIVLVFPYTASWKQSALHTYLLIMMDRLSFKPWLAKTILIIVPNSSNISTSHSVDAFFDLFYGLNTAESIPFSISSLLVRQLVVIESEFSDEQTSDKIIILPHGVYGTLPNLDLVSAVKKSLWRAWLRAEPDIQVHPYNVEYWEERVTRILPENRWIRQWGNDLIHMISFMMASFGRYDFVLTCCSFMTKICFCFTYIYIFTFCFGIVLSSILKNCPSCNCIKAWHRFNHNSCTNT